MEEKLVVTVAGYPELTSQTATTKMFKAFANMTVYLTTNQRFQSAIILDQTDRTDDFVVSWQQQQKMQHTALFLIKKSKHKQKKVVHCTSRFQSVLSDRGLKK